MIVIYIYIFQTKRNTQIGGQTIRFMICRKQYQSSVPNKNNEFWRYDMLLLCKILFIDLNYGQLYIIYILYEYHFDVPNDYLTNKDNL